MRLARAIVKISALIVYFSFRIALIHGRDAAIVVLAARYRPIGRAIEDFIEKASAPTACAVVLLLGLGAWLWPIGLGGRMPVGGDVTQFSIGPDGRAGRGDPLGPAPALERPLGIRLPRRSPRARWGSSTRRTSSSTASSRSRRPIRPAWSCTPSGEASAPLGGPAVRGLAPRVGAGRVRLVGLGVLRDPPAAPVGLHHRELDALGLGPRPGRSLAARRARARRSCWPSVLTLQVLPGHFQLAFTPRSAWRSWASGRSWNGSRAGPDRHDLRGGPRSWSRWRWRPSSRWRRCSSGRRIGWPLLAGPSRLSSTSRASPRRRSTWSATSRPASSTVAALAAVAWDPFHTSPEEHLAYVGLVPLFLALGAIVRGLRRDPGVRVLTVLVAGDPRAEPGAVRPGVLALEPAAGVLVLPGPGALEPGDRPGALPPGGQGVRSPAGLAAARPVAGPVRGPGGAAPRWSWCSGSSWPWPAPSGRAGRRSPRGSIAPAPLALDGRPRFPRAHGDRPPAPGRPAGPHGARAQGSRPGPADGLRLDRERFRIYAHELGGTGVLLVALAGDRPLRGDAAAALRRRPWSP